MGVAPEMPSDVRAAIEEACEEAGVTLIELILRGQLKQLVMEVLIDAVDGVTHDHCTAVSRGIDARLEGGEFYDRLRAVDVSSPGADAPVKYLWQLTKSVGRTVSVKRTDGTVIEGKLLRADDTGLDVLPQQKSKKETAEAVTVAAADVNEAKVVLKF